MDHRSRDVENDERPDPCEEQEKRQGKEYESHSMAPWPVMVTRLVAGSPALEEYGASRRGGPKKHTMSAAARRKIAKARNCGGRNSGNSRTQKRSSVVHITFSDSSAHIFDAFIVPTIH